MVVDEPQGSDGERAPTAEMAQLEMDAQVRRMGGRRAMLVVLSGTNVGTVVPLDVAEMTFGRDPECDVRLGDEGISRRHARFSRQGDGTWVVEDLGSTNGVAVNGRRIQREALSEGDRILVGHTVLKFGIQAEVDAAYQERVYEMSVRDALTRLYNRRYFDERLATEVAYARRHRTLLALLMLDIDHFKRVNDTRGHLVGDRVLMEVGLLVQQQVRSEDVLARFGGEEFAVLLREIPPPGVMVLAERIRQAVSELRVSCTGGDLSVTVSIGAHTMRGGPSLTGQGLVDAADRLLYRAKATGRNRTCAESAT